MLVAFCGIVAKKSVVNLFIMFLAMLMHIIVASGSVFGGLPFQNNYSVKIMKYSKGIQICKI